MKRHGRRWLAGGFDGELLARGFLMQRVRTLVGGGAATATIAFAVQIDVYGALHLIVHGIELVCGRASAGCWTSTA